MRRLVRSSRGPGSDRAYVTVLLVLVTGAPIVTVSMQMVNSVDATSLSIIASGAALLLAVVAVLIPTGFGPVSASESEIWFLVDGPIGPGAVLRPRVFLCMAIAVMFLATVGTGVAVARAGTAAEGAALGALLGLALGSTAVLAATATTPARRAIIALGCAAVVTVFSQSVVMVGVSATTLGLAAMVCLGGTVIAAIRVGRVPVSLLLVGTEHRASASAALFVGDLGIVTRAIRPG